MEPPEKASIRRCSSDRWGPGSQSPVHVFGLGAVRGAALRGGHDRKLCQQIAVGESRRAPARADATDRGGAPRAAEGVPGLGAGARHLRRDTGRRRIQVYDGSRTSTQGHVEHRAQRRVLLDKPRDTLGVESGEV